MTNQLITHRLPIDYSLMSSITYTWLNIGFIGKKPGVLIVALISP